MKAPTGLITSGVDTHLDVHAAATLDQVGGLLGTASFATTGCSGGLTLSPC